MTNINIELTLDFVEAGWILASMAWWFLTLRLRYNFQKTKNNKVAEYFYYFSAYLSTSFSFFTINRLFFMHVPLMSWFSLVIGIFLITSAFASFGYLLFYTKIPGISPKIGFAAVFVIGLAIAVMNIILPPYTVMEGGRAIDFYPHPVPAFLTFLVIVGTAFPFGIIIIQNALSINSAEEKIKSLGFGFLCFSGVFVAVFNTILRQQQARAISMIVWGIAVLLLTIFTQKKVSKLDVF